MACYWTPRIACWRCRVSENRASSGVSLPPASLLQTRRKFQESGAGPSCLTQTLSEAPTALCFTSPLLSRMFSPSPSGPAGLPSLASHHCLLPSMLQPEPPCADPQVPLVPPPFPAPCTVLTLPGRSPPLFFRLPPTTLQVSAEHRLPLEPPRLALPPAPCPSSQSSASLSFLYAQHIAIVCNFMDPQGVVKSGPVLLASSWTPSALDMAWPTLSAVELCWMNE